jgi:GntR family transcriptional regulator/MocR family aminotransferase
MTTLTSRASSQVDLPIRLDRTAEIPLGQQLIAQLRQAIAGGSLGPGARLPSTRALADALGVSRNLAVAAYDELFAEGYLEGRHGSGTYVASDLPVAAAGTLRAPTGERRWQRRPAPALPPSAIADTEPPPAGVIEFKTGVPAIGLLPPAAWRQIWREALAGPPPDRYAPPAGDPELCLAIARYAGRTRGIACGPEDVVITTGAAQAFDLLVRATLAPGDTAACEEPGYPTARHLLLANGARIVPAPVDDDGLLVERLPTGPAAPLLVYVTPSHQYPLGGRLPVARRLALLAWASAHDGLIVEDDYDSEFRFDAAPLPALLSLDHDGRVAYIGTFSKSLTPTLRAGYLIAPPALRERVVTLKALTDRHTSWPIQRALLALIAGGQLDRHIRRVRRHYAAHRAILRDGLAPAAPFARLIGLEAGIHACLELAPRPGLTAARVAAAARVRGVLVTPLDEYYHGPPTRQGLVLGYGGLASDELVYGAAILATVIRTLAQN